MKISVDRDFLLKLKRGILEAVCNPDGLDGSDGDCLLSHLVALLDRSEDMANGALSEIASDEAAESVELTVSHTDGSVSTIKGETPAMYSETNLAGSTEPHLTDEHLGVHTQWFEMSVTFRLDEATIEHKPGPSLD